MFGGIGQLENCSRVGRRIGVILEMGISMNQVSMWGGGFGILNNGSSPLGVCNLDSKQVRA